MQTFIVTYEDKIKEKNSRKRIRTLEDVCSKKKKLSYLHNDEDIIVLSKNTDDLTNIKESTYSATSSIRSNIEIESNKIDNGTEEILNEAEKSSNTSLDIDCQESKVVTKINFNENDDSIVIVNECASSNSSEDDYCEVIDSSYPSASTCSSNSAQKKVTFTIGSSTSEADMSANEEYKLIVESAEDPTGSCSNISNDYSASSNEEMNDKETLNVKCEVTEVNQMSNGLNESVANNNLNDENRKSVLLGEKSDKMEDEDDDLEEIFKTFNDLPAEDN